MNNSFSHIATALLLLAPFLSVPRIAAAKDSVPQWVRDANAQKLPTYPPETDAVKLLEETTLTVQGPGRTEIHYRVAIKILRPEGRAFAHLHTYFDKDSNIESLKIYSIGADGREYQLPDAEISNRGIGEGNLYYDEQERGGTALAADVGSVVAMEYDQRQRPYMNEDIWQYQSELPALKAVYTLELAPSFEYRATWFHQSPVEPVSAGSNRWQWTMTDVPAVDVRHITLHPSPESLYARMSVHYFGPGMGTPFRGDWASIGEWFSQLAEGRTAASPEIAAKAQELTAGKSDFYGKTAAIANFVQRDIRYYAIEIGIGGDQPHYAADIYRNRYGDCKDKATLLIAMLGAVGVQGHLVMVDHRRGVVNPSSPSSFGDHMIAAIEVPPGADASKLNSLVEINGGRRVVIFDPTQTWVRFGDLPEYEQGSYGLLMDGKKSQITALPVESPETSTVSRVGKFALHEDGTLTGEMTESRSGNAAWIRRDRLSMADAKQRGVWLDQLVRADLSTFSVQGPSVEHLQDLDQSLDVRYQVTAPQYSRTAGSMLLLRPRVFGHDSPDVDHESHRTLAVDLERIGMEHDEYSIELPPGYQVDELPAPVKLDVGFASYESVTSLTGNTLRYSRTLAIRNLMLPAEKYPALQKLAAVIKADEQGRAILKHAEKPQTPATANAASF